MPSDNSSSSGNPHAWVLLSGKTSQNPRLDAGFRIGDNSADPSGKHEFMLTEFSSATAGEMCVGHGQWDAGFLQGQELASTVQVFFEFSKSGARWAVGTQEPLERVCQPFATVRKIEISATATKSRIPLSVCWERIEGSIVFLDGQVETIISPCLPKADTALGSRHARSVPNGNSSLAIEQFAQMTLPDTAIQRLRIRGLVRLTAHPKSTIDLPLGPDDLQGHILVFTDDPS